MNRICLAGEMSQHLLTSDYIHVIILIFRHLEMLIHRKSNWCSQNAMRKISNVKIEATAFHQCGGAMGSVTVLMVLMKKTVQSLKQVSTFLACQLT